LSWRSANFCLIISKTVKTEEDCTGHKMYEEFYHLGYNAVESPPMFRRNISYQSSGSRSKQSKKPACEAGGNMEVTCFSETLVDF
jgi:hypothetical protein